MRAAVDSVRLRAAGLLLFLAAGAVLALVVDLPGVDAVGAWVDGAGPGVWAAMVAGAALVLLAPVPRSALSVLLGVVIGFGPGFAVALAAGLLSGVAAFGLSRVLGRAGVARLAGPRIEAMDRLVTGRGFGTLLVVRLIPFVPHVVVSYGAGLTAVRTTPYVFSTALGLIPSSAVQVGVGASAGLLADEVTTSAVVPVVVAVGVLGGVGVLAWWWRRTPRCEPV